MLRREVIRGIIIQSDLAEDLEAAWHRAIEQRDAEIFEAMVKHQISERTLAAATRLSRSYINKIRRTRGRNVA